VAYWVSSNETALSRRDKLLTFFFSSIPVWTVYRTEALWRERGHMGWAGQERELGFVICAWEFAFVVLPPRLSPTGVTRALVSVAVCNGPLVMLFGDSISRVNQYLQAHCSPNSSKSATALFSSRRRGSDGGQRITEPREHCFDHAHFIHTTQTLSQPTPISSIASHHTKPQSALTSTDKPEKGANPPLRLETEQAASEAHPTQLATHTHSF